MQIELSADQVTGLMLRMPSDARKPDCGITYDGESLHLDDRWQEAVEHIMSEEGWEAPLVADVQTPAQKLAAFLQSNPDVAEMIGLST